MASTINYLNIKITWVFVKLNIQQEHKIPKNSVQKCDKRKKKKYNKKQSEHFRKKRNESCRMCKKYIHHGYWLLEKIVKWHLRYNIDICIYVDVKFKPKKENRKDKNYTSGGSVRAKKVNLFPVMRKL